MLSALLFAALLQAAPAAPVANRLTLALGRIAALQNVHQLARPVAELHRVGIPALFPPPAHRLRANDSTNDAVRHLFLRAGDPPAAAAREARAALLIAVGLQQVPHGAVRLLHLAQLQRLTPSFDWIVYFRALDSPARVLRMSPAYLRALNGRLLTLPLADWQSYLRWRWLDATYNENHAHRRLPDLVRSRPPRSQTGSRLPQPILLVARHSACGC